MMVNCELLSQCFSQENAAYSWVKRFEGRGARSYEEACSGCHGPNGVGGVAAFTLADSDGNALSQSLAEEVRPEELQKEAAE